jgi:hypothetical protein
MLIAACVSAAPRGSSPVTLKYLGAAGWEISDGETVVLIDPYLSRLRHVIPNADPLATGSCARRDTRAWCYQHIGIVST